MAGSSLDAILQNTDLHSSPLREHGDTLFDSSFADRPSSPTEDAVNRRAQPTTASREPAPALGPSAPAKRRQSEIQHVETQATAKKLKPETKDELRKYVVASDTEREVICTALLLQMRDLILAYLLAMDASWKIPQGVDKNLNKYCIRILLSPNLARYDNDSVVKMVMGITERKLWGLSPTIRTDDDGKWDVLEARIRAILAQRKSEMKKLLVGSVDVEARPYRKKADNKKWHIVQLCGHLITIGVKSVKTNLVVTSPMCGRIAFLRQVLNDHGNNSDFWPNADNALEKLRAHEKDPKKRSKLFAAVLTEDLLRYPGANMTTVEKARESVVQGEVSEIITNQDFSHLEAEEPDDTEE